MAKTHKIILEYAYKNDVVSVGTFSKSILESHRKKGLLKFSPVSKNRYLITKKGLKLYKSEERCRL
jgi:predicted transcriptional regulator